jgi:hypothetical protein
MTMPSEGMPANSGTGDALGGMNPEWNDILGAVSPDVHEKLIPYLQGYDQKVQTRIQEATKQYDGYKDFLNIDPENIRIALTLSQALEENPQGIYEALAQDFGSKEPKTPTGPNPAPITETAPANDSNPYNDLPPQFVDEFTKLKESHDVMRQILTQQYQQEQQAKEDKELSEFYKGLMEKDPLIGELNKDGSIEPLLNAYSMAGYDEKGIIEGVASFVDKIVSYSQRPKPPSILGVGGFMPNQTTKPKDLSSDKRDEIAVQMLRHAMGS